MSALVFIDTETTSLRPDRRPWEIGLILRDETGDHEHHWFIDEVELDLGNADPFALKIGRFHERHPQANDVMAHDGVKFENTVLLEIERLTRGAHIVGAVPNFDTEVLARRMRKNGILPSWHYHLIDVEALAVGYLWGQNGWRRPDDETRIGVSEITGLPWSSDQLSVAVGVQVDEAGRHTALGDARWARDIYDAVTKYEPATRPPTAEGVAS